MQLVPFPCRSAALATLVALLLAGVYTAACVGDSVTGPTTREPLAADGGGSDAKACVPGASIACTGQSGCPSSQVCSADGTALGPCTCTVGSGDGGQPGMDAAPTDSGDAGLSSTLGAVHLTWILKGATTGSTLTCAQVTNQTGVELLLTASGGAQLPVKRTFPCVGNEGDLVAVPVGTYTAVADMLNAMSQSLGSSAATPVTVASSPCDTVVSNECVRNLTTTILIDGM